MEKDNALKVYCENKPLIDAITALKDDSDYNQWFTDGRYWMICKYNEISIGFIDAQNSAEWNGFPHKATIEELIEKFI